MKKKLIVKKAPCNENEYHTLFSSGLHEIFINKLKVGEYRYETFNNEEFLVVPVTIIVEGVHNGFFYPAEELKESVENWEGVLVPIYHPEDENGEFLSAKEVESECAGRFYNSAWDENKKGIVGEFWLLKKKLTEEVIEELINGDMEVSTGLYASHDFEKAGTWNDEKYIAELSDYEPDHVALLPGSLGACSWEDGCGVRVNKKAKEDNKNLNTNLNDKEVTEETMFDKLKGLVKKIILFNSVPEEEKTKYMEKYKNDLLEGIVVNKLSYEDVRYTIYQLLQEAFTTPEEKYPDVYVRSTYNDNFVFERKGKLYQQSYTVDSDDQITLGAEITEVKVKSEYVPVSNEKVIDEKINNEKEDKVVDNKVEEKTKTNKEEVMNKEELIVVLISNEDSPFTDADKDFLMGKDEAVLQGLVDKFKKEEKIEKKVNDKEDKVEDKLDANGKDNKEEKIEKKLSVDDYLQNVEMPEEVKGMISDSVELYKNKKESLITKILANEKNIFTKEQLNKKDPKELAGIVALMGKPEKSNDKVEEDDFDFENFDFSGNLPGFISKQTEVSNVKQPDGKGVPDVMIPKWNADGTPDRSQFMN